MQHFSFSKYCNEILKVRDFARMYDSTFVSVLNSVRDVPEQPKRLARTFFAPQFLTRCLASKEHVTMTVIHSVVYQVHSTSQSEFSTVSDLVLPFPISSKLSLLYGHRAAAYVFFLFFPSLHLSFHNVYQKAFPTSGVTNPVSLPSFCCL